MDPEFDDTFMSVRQLDRIERSGAIAHFVELFAIAFVQFLAGLGMAVMTSHVLLALLLILLSCLSLYLASLAAASFETFRDSVDQPARARDVLWASSRLRLCVLLADGGFIVAATVLLWLALTRRSDLVMVPAAVLCFFGLRAILVARAYHRARVRELESRG